MKAPKLLIALFAMFLALGIAVPASNAADDNQETKLTFSEPVEIPGHILPAGTYWFQLTNNDFNRNIVEIFNQDRSRVIATLQTVDSYRQKPADDTIISFAERPADQPEAIRTWFHPGREDGHEFLYSAQEEREVARDTKVAVTATPSDEAAAQPAAGD
jgi:hypothetical protein